MKIEVTGYMVQLYGSTKFSHTVVSTTSCTRAQTVYYQSPSKKFDQGHSSQIRDMQPTRTAKGRYFPCFPVIYVWCNLVYQIKKVPPGGRSLGAARRQALRWRRERAQRVVQQPCPRPGQVPSERAPRRHRCRGRRHQLRGMHERSLQRV